MSADQNKRMRIWLTLICALLVLCTIVFAFIFMDSTSSRTFIIATILLIGIIILILIWTIGRKQPHTEIIVEQQHEPDEKPVTLAPEVHETPSDKLPPQSVKIDEHKEPIVPVPQHSPIDKNKVKIMEKQPTETGSTCQTTGVYYCCEHPQRSVRMVEGRKFPPCRGLGKGHSAIWTLTKPTAKTHTGAFCKASGQYHCKDHPSRIIQIEEGKRFPPCRVEGKGHSAEWVLMN
ncbi:MAG: hypothetical protein GXY60_09430 [Spirochaetales bacterium]|nr:hypothetical protein [Spirochaetales bacterium]